MILAWKLKQILVLVPDDARISAYEGEDVGLNIKMSPSKHLWIRARNTDKEDEQLDKSLASLMTPKKLGLPNYDHYD